MNPTTATNPMNAFAEALTPKVAVSYLRVSTTGQARRGGGDEEGFSIPAQRDANKRKAASLGAMVIKEFVDRGASARSANRPELQRMLEYVNEHDVDYVIVHKLDRLARNRSDDVEIVRALEAANVQLVSTTEAIDATPSGMLLHGIMSSIAEFYSRNLAAEVTKGLSTKAQRGGTVSKAPIGYRNHRTVDGQGRELRTVIVDDERAQHVKNAFGLYATGAWTVAALAEFLANHGFTTVPTPKVPSKPMSEKYLHRVLTNPYYRGIVTYKGVQYDGRHERFVDDETWFKVQSILDSHYNGDRVRKHNHYLKNSLWCGQCGERMLVTNSKSASGDVYPYFFCAGRHSKRTSCTQSSVLIYEIERKVEDLYLRVQLDATFRERVETQMRAELAEAQHDVERRRVELKKMRERLTRERGKLLEAHYAGAIPVDLLGQEQDRISKGLASIQTELDAANEKWEVIERNLGLALDLATDTHGAYLSAPEHIRRLFNQAFFEKILVLPDENDRVGVRLEAELAEPFDTLLSKEKRSAGDASGPLQSSNHSSALTQSICLSKNTVVDLRRDFENTGQAHKTVHSRWSRGYYREQVRAAQPPVRDSRGPIVGAVGKVQTFLAPAQIEALVASYRAGASTTELSATFGIHRRTVVVHLHRQGVTLRRDGLAGKHTADAVRLYGEGLSLAEIATIYGTTARTIRAALLARGVEMRKPWDRPRRPQGRCL